VDTIEVLNYHKRAIEARKAGNVELSVKILLEGREYCKSNNDFRKIYNSLGSSFYKLSDYHTALTYYDSSYIFALKMNSPVFISYLQNNFGLVYMQLENFEKAISNYQMALKNIGNQSKGLVFYNIAKCYDYLDSSDSAIYFYKKSYKTNIKEFGEINYYSLLTALELFEHGKVVNENLYNSLIQLDNPQLLGIYYMLVGNYDKAEHFLKNNSEQLLRFYVKSKQWEKAIPVIDTLRQSYLSLNSKLFLQANEMLIYKHTIDKYLDIDVHKAFKFAQKSYGNVLRELTDYNVNETIDSYNYFDFDSLIYLFVLDNKKIIFHRIKTGKEFWGQYQLFKESLDFNIDKDYHKTYIQFCKSANYLYKKLVPDPSEEMLIIPGGKIQNIPFECLVVEFPKDTSLPDFKSIDYLINHSIIRYDYVLRSYCFPSGCNKVTAFAPDNSLEFAKEEIKQLRLFNSKRLLGNDARIKYLQEGDIIHIATHYQPENYSISFSDSSLKLDELNNLRKNMVVLSTCRSGDGKLYKSEGLYSPGRAFYIAGAASVVENLWDAVDKSSYYIIWNFYKQLALGKDKATALRKAKLKYITNCPHHISHPYFWANMRVFGCNSPIKLQINRFIIFSVISLILLNLIFIKYLFSRK
jgi:tetratricopeptide (TPR) repeat protein